MTRFRPAAAHVQGTLCILLLGMAGWACGDGTSRRLPWAGGGEGSIAFSGSESCRPCHEQFYSLWSTSHHGLAMQPFTPEFARDHLLPLVEDLSVGDYTYTASFDDTGGWVTESGLNGKTTYPIEHALGGKNIYYFLTPMERGRLQVLPVAYDVRRREWFNTTGSMVRHFVDRTDEALDWREQPLTFNTSCYNCHVSQLSSHYDLATDTYQTSWGEPGINCETCHGPGGEHVRVFSKLREGQTAPDLKLISTAPFTAEQNNALCAPCHAKMQPLTTTFQPGDAYFDHFDLATLEDQDFYPDGRDLGENYTYTLWRMSPCVASGQLDCMHCHTSSGRYRFSGAEANNACMPCHPSQVEHPAEHSRHPADSEGSLCISCHMPRTEFARMIRSDHSMRPPAPAASIAFGSPNACTLCHTDESAEWADRWVRKWRTRDYQAPIIQQARLIDAARKRDWTSLPAMLTAITGPSRDEVVATSLIRLLAWCTDARKWPALLQAMDDPSPLVRSAAAFALRDSPDSEATRALFRATQDSVRLVRVRATSALAESPLRRLSPEEEQHLRAVLDEYEASLGIRLDQWTTHYNLGNYYVNRGLTDRALASFDAASRLEPAAVAPLANAAIVYSASGRNDLAEQRLRSALALEPDNAVVNLNLGLLLGEQRRFAEAEAALRRAAAADPELETAAYNLCVLLAETRLDEALPWCRKASELRPDLPRYGYSYAFYLDRNGNTEQARRLLEQITTRHPGYVEAYLLLGATYERAGRPKDAAAVYRRALNNPAVTERDRSRLTARLESVLR